MRSETAAGRRSGLRPLRFNSCRSELQARAKVPYKRAKGSGKVAKAVKPVRFSKLDKALSSVNALKWCFAVVK
jgi:hypothetical protein